MKKLKNIHPGEILNEEFLIPMRISQNKLARYLGISPRRINQIVLEERSITPETDLLLSKFFGTSEGFWIRLQSSYDLEEAKRSMASKLKHITPYQYTNHHSGLGTHYQ